MAIDAASAEEDIPPSARIGKSGQRMQMVPSDPVDRLRLEGSRSRPRTPANMALPP